MGSRLFVSSDLVHASIGTYKWELKSWRITQMVFWPVLEVAYITFNWLDLITWPNPKELGKWNLLCTQKDEIGLVGIQSASLCHRYTTGHGNFILCQYRAIFAFLKIWRENYFAMFSGFFMKFLHFFCFFLRNMFLFMKNPLNTAKWSFLQIF